MLQNVIVQATRDFTVGPSREVVIREGTVRNVEIDDDGYFSTHTFRFGWFGMCQVGRGWKVLPQ